MVQLIVTVLVAALLVGVVGPLCRAGHDLDRLLGLDRLVRLDTVPAAVGTWTATETVAPLAPAVPVAIPVPRPAPDHDRQPAPAA